MARPLPRTLLIPEAKQAEVSKLAAEVLAAQGALLDEKTHARTVFEGLRSEGGLRRGGYVGAYQPIGEKQVEVLVQVWATGPRRFFWATVSVQFVIVLGMFLASPPSATWFLGGIVLWLWFAGAALVYLLSFRGSMAVEEDLLHALRRRFEGAGLPVLDEDAQLERAVRERLEGEVKEREVEARLREDPPPKRTRAKSPRPKPAGKEKRRGKAEQGGAAEAAAGGDQAEGAEKKKKRGLLGPRKR